ncbi:MAG: 2-isopropylmalate synthase [Phycisphaerae bacterium SM23_33]|nr:MAG: 2-isopropylmalate synthase [Phycisphaerae bacterium SM23_33]
MTEPRTILIFDTTLRDGEQSPGCSMNLKEKLEVARALEGLRVDVIEAGFPVASPGDFEAVRAIAREITGCTVAGLARTIDEDIDRAGQAVAEAAHPRIHVFCATSSIHRQYKLKRAKEEILRMSVEGVRRARQYTDDVEFSPEDASRTEWDFLVEVVTGVIEAGATTVNIPDTVGYAIPNQFGELIRHLRQNVSNINRAVISVHCHNDLGLAVANSLEAVRAGAGQVECTINGLGERAGNAALEEIVMALKTRSDVFSAQTRIDTRKIYPASRLVSSITGVRVQRNKAVVGENAFAHEAGIHQHGMLSHRETYEIMRPEDVGLPAGRLVLGKHSGRHALKERIEAMGHSLDDSQLNEVFERFKALADKKKDIFDADVEALIDQQLGAQAEVWTLDGVQTTAGSNAIPTATVTLTREGESFTDAATGDGPVDAIYEAIGRITGMRLALRDYSLRALTSGKDAQGEVTIEVEHEGRKLRARGVSTDIVEASAKAYLAAVNRAITAANAAREKPEQP